LAESNGSLPPGGWLQVTCGQTAGTLGSAPSPTLGNEYHSMGEHFTFTHGVRFSKKFWRCLAAKLLI